MKDNRKLIVRKAKDGINYEAVIRDYCGRWYDHKTWADATPRGAIAGLIKDMISEINYLENDLCLAMYGHWEFESEKGE